MREALRLWQSNPRANPVALASAHHDLGRVLWFLAEYDDAEREYRAALRLRTKHLGPEHIETARSAHHLAATLQGKGAFNESEHLWLETIRIRRAVLPPSHPDIPNTLVGYGSFLQEVGRHAEASDVYADALALITHISGEDDWRTARTTHGLGVCLIDLGEYAPARDLLDRALEVKLMHGDEYDTTRTRLAIARLDLLEGADLEDTLASVSACVQRLEASFGLEHPNTGDALVLEARLLLAMHRPQDAEASARLSMAAFESRWSNRSWRMGQAAGVLAQSLIEQGRAPEAVEPAARSRTILMDVRDAGDRVRRESEDRAMRLGLLGPSRP